MRRARSLIVVLVLGLAQLAGAQEPGKQPKKDIEQRVAPKQMEELLPPPQIVPPGNLLYPYARPTFPQFGTRDVWQYYGVDSAGRFRPRVILSPFGAYYSVNGAPYPWTTTQPRLYMPYILD
jgi:hypothetical protein